MNEKESLPSTEKVEQNVTAPRRKMEKAERREEILEAARAVFSEKGYQRATTKAIAKRAGVAEGTIFIYFSTKRDLLVSCIQHIIIEPLSGMFGRENVSDEEMITSFIQNRFRIFKKNIGMIRLMVAEGLYDPDLFREIFHKIFNPGLMEIANYFRRRMDSGAFKQLDPNIAARSLVGHVISSVWLQILSEDDIETILNEDLAETLAQIFLNGIRA